MTGRFITLEGIEGAGKTTQASLLAARLADLCIPCLLVREPGGTPLGEEVRDALLRPRAGDLLPLTEALLFSAARAELTSKVILPALAQGQWVVCERYVDSTLAYQGFGGGVSLDVLRTLNSWSSYGVVPDLTLLLDLDPELAFSQRIRWKRLDRVEARPLEFHRRVREGFLKIAEAEPERIRRVDASAPEDVVFERCFGYIRAALLSGGVHAAGFSGRGDDGRPS